MANTKQHNRNTNMGIKEYLKQKKEKKQLKKILEIITKDDNIIKKKELLTKIIKGIQITDDKGILITKKEINKMTENEVNELIKEIKNWL